ncbi:MAG: hypothetical protein ABIP90_03525, partial [Vicinamibacterales bacterium]
ARNVRRAVSQMTPKADHGNDVGCLLSSKKTPDVIVFGMVLAGTLLGGGVLHACPICFRVEESATTDGLRLAVLVLVGVTTVVLGALARFIVGFAKRERRQSAELPHSPEMKC